MSRGSAKVNRNPRKWRRGLTVLAGLILVGIFCRPGLGENLWVTPNSLTIKEFFGGARLRVSGEIPRGAGVVMEIVGPTEEQDLMRRAPRWDLWMNVGEIDIIGLPGFYLVASSIPEMLTGPEYEKPWGYGLWRRTALFQGDLKKGEETFIFNEFIKLKEGYGLYGRFPGGVMLMPAGEGRERAQATFPINTRIAPGVYTVRLLAVRGGRIIHRDQVAWRVDMGGIPAFLTYLANQRPVLYGLLALGLAAAVGMFSALLLKQK
jgi:hypothetical protein